MLRFTKIIPKNICKISSNIAYMFRYINMKLQVRKCSLVRIKINKIIYIQFVSCILPSLTLDNSLAFTRIDSMHLLFKS